MKRILLILGAWLLGWQTAAAQDLPKRWTLQECLDYALENNIQLQQSRNDHLSGLEDTEAARAAMLPSLSASTTQALTNYPSAEAVDNNSYTGTYGITAGITVFEGGRLRTALQRQQTQNRMDALTVDETANDIRIAIVQAYMQTLYALEAVEVARSTVEVSSAQRDRAEQMLQAGSTQLESQLASDRYQVVAAQATLDDCKLQLKQLLELDIMGEIEVVSPDRSYAEVMRMLPDKAAIYDKALEAMPEIALGALAVEAAELDVKQAQAGYWPSVSLTASLGTGHISGENQQTGTQVWNRFNESLGLTISIPIFSNRQNRTAVNKARLAVENSRLSQLDLEKTLLREVESAYLDAVSAQSQYVAAVEKQRYAQQSYDLTDEQFRVGMKNTVELITAQNELTAARQEVLQAKYMALMNLNLLDIYQGNEIQ